MTQIDLLDSIFGRWKQNASEAIAALGEEETRFFVDVYNDALEIQAAISGMYPTDELANSLVYMDFMGVTKEVHWFLVMFLAGNCPLLLGRLRFLWELIFRGLYAESYEKKKDVDPEPPSHSIDGYHEWLKARIKLDWNTVIEPVLRKIFTAEDAQLIDQHFKPIWKTLHCYVHPSAEWREDLIDESALLVRDGFDRSLVEKTLAYSAAVFELVWLAVLSRFPLASRRLVADPNTFRQFPRLQEILKVWVNIERP